MLIAFILLIVFAVVYKINSNKKAVIQNNNDTSIINIESGNQEILTYTPVPIDDATPTCPYCKTILKKQPVRKTKCQICKKFFFVKYRPTDRVKRIVTEEEKDKIQKEWENHRWVDHFSCYYGLTENDFILAQENISKKFGRPAPIRDTVWSIFNQLLLKESGYQQLSGIYFDMARFLEDDGKDSFQCRYQHQKMVLLNYKHNQSYSIVKKVSIETAIDSCDNCLKQQDKVFTIDRAIKEMPLPCKNCNQVSHGYCRCIYLPVIND